MRVFSTLTALGNHMASFNNPDACLGSIPSYSVLNCLGVELGRHAAWSFKIPPLGESNV